VYAGRLELPRVARVIDPVLVSEKAKGRNNEQVAAAAQMMKLPVKCLRLPPVPVIQDVVAGEKSSLVAEALHVVDLGGE
jgi:hypothetical protein